MLRVRFAPSPTGNLHIGNARTALINLLFARSNGGSFLLRIEDTDVERSDAAFESAILEDLRWLGVNWDEGPVRQTDRLSTYTEWADKLLASGQAYKCFCTVEELEHQRREALRRGLPPRYTGRCRDLTAYQVKDRQVTGQPFVIRFRAPRRRIEFKDLLHGTVAFPPDHVDDFIIIRNDGVPAYNFAVVIDDMLMGVTHVIRGSDHLSNTPKQIMLFEILGGKPPAYGHHGLLLGGDKKPLSKRHGASNIAELRAAGILPEAVANYLGIIGKSAKKEVLSRDELIREFSLESFSASDQAFDYEKLRWLNKEHLRQASPERLSNILGLPHEFQSKIALLRENAGTLVELREQLDIFDGEEMEKEALDFALKIPALGVIVERISGLFSETARPAIEDLHRLLKESPGLARKDVFMLLRVMTTGRKSGPPLTEAYPLISTRSMVGRLACLQKRLSNS
ncbi:MAG TPA: glutamate--tRNA ligase [Deltaproteobacteria bacterium]|nr:glutamate--tRNA ligase [Deltaproteobacteria bacterium]